MKIFHISRNDRELWDHVVEESSTGTIFHTDDWIKILETSLRMHVTRLAAIEKGEIIGILPIAFNMRPTEWLRVRRLPLTATSPPLRPENPYGGPIALPGRSDAVVELVKYVLKKSPSADITFSPDPANPAFGLPELADLRTTISTRSTYIVDLTRSEDEMWRSCNGNMRTHVRKAKQLGVKLVSSSNPLDMDHFHRILHEAYSHSGILPLARQFYFNAFTMLKEKRRAELFFAVVDGKLASSEISLIFKNRIYSWTGGSDRSFHSYSPNNLLSWEIAKWGKARGLSDYDLCGADVPSIAKFKAGLGGRLYRFPCVSWKSPIYSAMSRTLKMVGARSFPGYNTIRRLASLIN